MKYGAIGIISFHFAQTASDCVEICQSISAERFVKRFVGAGNGKLVAVGFTTGYEEAGGTTPAGQAEVLLVSVADVEAVPPLRIASQHVVLAFPPERVAGGWVAIS